MPELRQATSLNFYRSIDLKISVDGNKWLIKPRQKTGISKRVVLLPPAPGILHKYAGRSINQRQMKFNAQCSMGMGRIFCDAFDKLRKRRIVTRNIFFYKTES